MLLTIGIPTYNRVVFLRDNLDVLLPQLINYKDEVEVVVSDNASDDNTGEVVRELSDKFGVSVLYKRQETNIGPEDNAIWITNNSKGEYIYLMGDDDILSPNFISIIIPLLKSKEEIAAIHWNRLSGDADCNNNVLVDNVFTGEALQSFTPFEFIIRVMEKPNFISSIIFNKDVLALGAPYFKEEYLGYKFFAQMYFGIILSGRKCLYYYFPLVIQRNPSKSWIKYWPLYLASSMSNIFYDLDKEAPGVYNKWTEKLRKEVPCCLHAAGRYRSYYSQPSIKEKMVKHLTRKEKLQFKYYLIPGTFFLYQIKAKVLQLFQRILG